MNKDTDFYNKEGTLYSQKRYPTIDTDYVHFFFKRRRDLLMNFINLVSKKTPSNSLIEVGCADGVVINYIANRYSFFNKLVGIDLSEKMIKKAKKSSDKIEFYIRDKEYFGNFDYVVEIGVINLTDFDTEINFAKKNLKTDGYFICSLASITSLRIRLKKFNKNKDEFNNLLTYREYEQKLKESFKIIKQVPYGLFIPYIWKWPLFARTFQPFFEYTFQNLTPNLFHEKIYLLKKEI